MPYNAGQAEANVTFSMSFDYGDYLSDAQYGVEDDTQPPTIYYYYPNATSQKKNVCPIPAGEVSTAVDTLNWPDQIGGRFSARLKDKNSNGQLVDPPDAKYRGRHVDESVAGFNDGCYFQGSDVEKIVSALTGPGWTIAPYYASYDQYDQITNPRDWVEYYQGKIRLGVIGNCSETDTQTLKINGCGAGALPTIYHTNVTGVALEAHKVTATRGNASIALIN